MNDLPDMAAIGSSPSYICVINLLSPSLCIPAVLLFMWINISVDDFHSPVGSCLFAIKTGIWKWPEPLWHSKCSQITQHQSHCVSNTLLYHHPLFAYVSDSFTNSILCSYKYHFEWRNALCMHNAAQDPYLKQLCGVSSAIPAHSANGGGIVGTVTIFQSTAVIKWQMTKQAIICWAGVDLMYYCSQGRKKIFMIQTWCSSSVCWEP